MIPAPRSTWTPESQDSFQNYMGQVVDGWANVTSASLRALFKGDENSITRLWKIISNGKLIPGAEPQGVLPVTELGQEEVKANLQKSMFGYAIPVLWRVSGTYAFVLDSGYECDENRVLSELSSYLTDETMEATGECYDGTQYYLVHPKGSSQTCPDNCNDNSCPTDCYNSKFSAPTGLDTLGGGSFKNVTKRDLIVG